MALSNEFPVVSSNLKAGLGVYGTVDPLDTTKPNNGARNPLGSLWYIPAPSVSGVSLGSSSVGQPVLASSAGFASGLWVRYVQYKSTGNPATVTGPAPVYYTDETMSIVSGVSTESVAGVNGIAGWLLPNSGTGTYGLGSTLLTNTILNGGTVGSFVFIGLCGFIPGAISVASTVAGDALIAAATNFTVARVAAGTAPTNKILGFALTAVASGLSDVMAQVWPF